MLGLAPNVNTPDGLLLVKLKFVAVLLPNWKTEPAELDVVVAPKLKPEVAVLLLLAPVPKTNGVTAVPVLDVVAGLLS